MATAADARAAAISFCFDLPAVNGDNAAILIQISADTRLVLLGAFECNTGFQIARTHILTVDRQAGVGNGIYSGADTIVAGERAAVAQDQMHIAQHSEAVSRKGHVLVDHIPAVFEGHTHYVPQGGNTRILCAVLRVAQFEIGDPGDARHRDGDFIIISTVKINGQRNGTIKGGDRLNEPVFALFYHLQSFRGAGGHCADTAIRLRREHLFKNCSHGSLPAACDGIPKVGKAKLHHEGGKARGLGVDCAILHPGG